MFFKVLKVLEFKVECLKMYLKNLLLDFQGKNTKNNKLFSADRTEFVTCELCLWNQEKNP